MTASFGITALNELQELHNGKSIREDGEFALEVMKYINEKITEFIVTTADTKNLKWMFVLAVEVRT